MFECKLLLLVKLTVAIFCLLILAQEDILSYAQVYAYWLCLRQASDLRWREVEHSEKEASWRWASPRRNPRRNRHLSPIPEGNEASSTTGSRRHSHIPTIAITQPTPTPTTASSAGMGPRQTMVERERVRNHPPAPRPMSDPFTDEKQGSPLSPVEGEGEYQFSSNPPVVWSTPTPAIRTRSYDYDSDTEGSSDHGGQLRRFSQLSYPTSPSSPRGYEGDITDEYGLPSGSTFGPRSTSAKPIIPILNVVPVSPSQPLSGSSAHRERASQITPTNARLSVMSTSTADSFVTAGGGLGFNRHSVATPSYVTAEEGSSHSSSEEGWSTVRT